MMEYWNTGILGLARMECVMNANIIPQSRKELRPKKSHISSTG
jgi:hypothetical protein